MKNGVKREGFIFYRCSKKSGQLMRNGNILNFTDAQEMRKMKLKQDDFRFL